MPLRKSTVIIRSTPESPLPKHLELVTGIFIGYARSGTARILVNGQVEIVPVVNINDGNLR